MLRLNSRDKNFAQAFERLVSDRRESDDNIARDVQVILSDVRNRGDAALAEMTARRSGLRPSKASRQASLLTVQSASLASA